MSRKETLRVWVAIGACVFVFAVAGSLWWLLGPIVFIVALKADMSTKAARILTVVGVILACLYFAGRLDYALYPLGLNFNACGRNGFGATFCGDDLTAYQARWRSIQQQVTATQCRLDSSLPNCP